MEITWRVVNRGVAEGEWGKIQRISSIDDRSKTNLNNNLSEGILLPSQRVQFSLPLTQPPFIFSPIGLILISALVYLFW